MSGFTTKFGNTTVKPAQPSYLNLSIAANTTLVWPIETMEGVPYVATQIDVTATVASLSLAMPSAIQGSTGQVTMITNIGTNALTLTDNVGNAIVVLNNSVSWVISLTSNTTQAGTYRAVQLGSTTTTAQAAQLADNISTQATAGGKLQTIEGTNYYTTNQAIALANRSSLNILQVGSSSSTFTLDTTTNLTDKWFADFSNETVAAVLTITGTGGQLINGNVSITLNPGTSCRIVCSTSGTPGFNIVGGELIGTQYAVVLAGGTTGTPTSVASLGTSGQALLSNGPGTPPSFQANTAIIINPTDLVINAGCRVGARADAAITVSVPTANSLAYGGVDMIQCGVTGSGAAVGAGTISRQSGNSFGSTGFSVQMTGLTTTGSTSTVEAHYRMESRDADAYVNQTASFSCIVRQNTGTTQNYIITVNKATVSDNFTAVTQIAQSGAIAAANNAATLVAFNGVAMGACGNGIEIVVSSNCGVVTTKNFDFTDFSAPISTSSYASTRPVLNYDTDLLNCSRYLPRIFTSASTDDPVASGFNTSTTVARVNWSFGVPARVQVTAILTAASGTFFVFDAATGNQGVSAVTLPTSKGGLYGANLSATTSGVTSGGPSALVNNTSGTAYVIATGAEL